MRDINDILNNFDTCEEAVKWACNVDSSSSEPIKTYRLLDAV
jgi:hypothetical protein